MSTPPLVHLTETSPGTYETRWTVPHDLAPGTYELVAVEILGGVRLASTPSAILIVLPAVAPAPGAPTPPRPVPKGPPPAPELRPLELPPEVVRRVPGRDYGWADPRQTVVETPLWVTVDDAFVVGVRTSLAGQVLALTTRLWAPDGHIQQSVTTIKPPADRTLNWFRQQLDMGYLVGAQVVVTSAGAAPQRGECFVTLRLARGLVTNFITQQILGADYVTGMKPVGWPGGRVIDSVEWPGWVKDLLGGAVGAGADFNYSVPFATRWRVRFLRAQLVTSATVANRIPSVRLLSMGTIDNRLVGAFTQTASQTFTYTWVAGATVGLRSDTSRVMDFLPGDFVIHDGDFLGTITAGIQAADQWSAMHLLVEELLEDTSGGSPS